MTPPTTLAARTALEIRAEIGRQHRSDASLARALGWSKMALSRRLTGAIPFDLKEVEDIAFVLGVPVSQLVPLTVAA